MGKLKTIVKFFSVLILIGLILVAVLVLLIELKKPYLINKAETWYAENHTGELKIKDFDIQFIRTFPNLGIQVHHVSLRDSSCLGRNYRRFYAKGINFNCVSRELLNKKIEFNRLNLVGVNLDVLVDTLIMEPSSQKKSFQGIENWLENRGAKFKIQDSKIKFVNRPKKKRYSGSINEISGELAADGSILKGPLHLDLVMHEMGFNVDQGTFFNTAHIRGDLEPEIDLKKKEFYTPPFELKIDDQDFLVSAHFNLGEENFFDFELINESTDYQASKGLITQNLQKVIEPFHLVKPFYTKTKIQGKFKNQGNMLLVLDFNTQGNQFVFADSLQLDSLGFSGYLANRTIDDVFLESKKKKNFHFIFSDLSGNFKGIDFALNDSYIQNTPRLKNFINLNLTTHGEMKRLNQLINNKDFSFKSGVFNLNSNYKGIIKELPKILIAADNQVSFTNTDVLYTKSDFIIPIQQVLFNTTSGNAVLESMNLKLPKNQNIEIFGSLDNYTSLVSDEATLPIKSTINIESESLDYEKLISVLQSSTKNLEKNEKDLKPLFEKIYFKFNPNLAIKIDKFVYQNIEINDFKSLISYQDQNTIALSDSQFKFEEGTIDLDGQVHFPEGNSTEGDLGIKADGSMTSLNELFNTKDFVLEKGRFKLNADYQGSLDSPNNILTGSEVELQILDTKIYHAEQDLMIPIESSTIQLQKRDAKIIDLNIPISIENMISINGEVENFTSLLKDESRFEVHSNVIITSDKLSTNNFKKIINILSDPDNAKPSDKEAIQRGVAMAYKKFDPQLKIQIDTIESSEYLLNNVHSNIYYQDSMTIAVDESGFELDEGRLDLDAIFNFSEKDKIVSDLLLSANGKANSFNKLFKNNTFFFKEGIFDFNLGFAGNALNKSEFIRDVESRLILEDSKVFYKDLNLTVPLDDVEVILRKEAALINSFVIPLSSGHRIKISGSVNNFNTLLLDSIPVEVTSDLNIYSKELDFQDLTRLFDVITTADSLSNNDPTTTIKKTNVLKPALKGIYDKFQPRIHVVIDDFWYTTFNAKNIRTGLHFLDRDHIELDQTELELGEAHVLLDAQLDLTELDRTGFNTDFMAEKLPLDALIPAFNYFGLPSLKSAGKVNGILTVDTHLNGHINDKTSSIDTSLQGTIAFNLENLRLKNFVPITSTAGKILKDKRINDIQFLPLIDTLTIGNGAIKIKDLNIASNAFTLYLKGDFRYDNHSNLLVSIPWSNLWFWDVNATRERLLYSEAGRKFHIHAIGNNENTIDYKFRFSGRKWYKKQGILDRFKKERKACRLHRKYYKKELRKERRRERRKRKE